MTIVDYIKKSDIEDIIKLFYKLDTVGFVDIINYDEVCMKKECQFFDDYDCSCTSDDCPYAAENRHCEIARRQMLEFLNTDVGEPDDTFKRWLSTCTKRNV